MSIFGGGTKKTTTTRNVPAPTPQETALLNQQVDLAATQLQNLAKVGAFTAENFQALLPELVGQINQFLPQSQQITGDSLGFSGQAVDAQGQLLQSELDAINQGVTLQPDQAKLIEDATNASIQAGLSDISAFRDESLRSLAQETAIGRGLRPNDTPILDVGGRIVNESSRQASQLVQNLRGQEATAKLQYPIQAGQFVAGRTQAQQQLAAGQQSFVEQLRQQAFNNRLQLTALLGQQGLGLASIGPNSNTLPALANTRIAATTETSKEKGGGGGLGSLLGAAGGFLEGLGAVGVSFSDRRLKRVGPRIGRTRRGVPVYLFRYLWDRVTRAGVLAQEAMAKVPAAVLRGPGGFLMVDYARI